MEWKTFRSYITNLLEEAMNVERIIHKFNVRNYVSKLESPCESMSDHSSRNCFNLSHLMKIVIESPQTLSE